MTPPTPIEFAYSGKELQAPLARLLRHLRERQEALRLDLLKFAHVSEDDFVQWAQSAPSSSTKDRNALAQNYLATMAKVRETELFLFECQRSPKHWWSLTIEQLAELYPTQIAPETTAKQLLGGKRRWL